MSRPFKGNHCEDVFHRNNTMLSWTHSCTFGVIFCSVFSAFVEQKTWLLMSGMNDIHFQISVLFEREHVGCLECALTANIANGESFSCKPDVSSP